jgi:hypothetical protein
VGVAASPAAAGPTGVIGRATGSKGVLANAAVQVFRLGQQAAVGEGTTGPDGKFGVVLKSPVPPGVALQVTANGGGQRLVSIGSAALITNDGGSLISNDGGSLISNDGGSLISNDGGSVVAQGAGNYGLLAVKPQPTNLTPATTLAVAVLAPRFAAAGKAAASADGGAIEPAVEQVLAAFGVLSRAADAAIAKDPSLGAGAVAATGPGADLLAKLANDPAITAAFQAAAKDLDAAIASGVAAGGTRPDATELAPVSLGGVTAPEVTLPAPTPPPASGTTGGDGSDGATQPIDGPSTQDAGVSLTGTLAQPRFSPTPTP